MIAINGGFRGIFPKPAPERRADFGTMAIQIKRTGHDWRFPLSFSQPIAVVAGFGEIAAEESVMAMIGGFR